MNKLPTITADFLEEEVEEPNDDSRLPTRYCKDGPAVEIGGYQAAVDASARRGYHDVGRAAARVPV
jgi:hypothetical protein